MTCLTVPIARVQDSAQQEVLAAAGRDTSIVHGQVIIFSSKLLIFSCTSLHRMGAAVQLALFLLCLAGVAFEFCHAVIGILFYKRLHGVSSFLNLPTRKIIEHEHGIASKTSKTLQTNSNDKTWGIQKLHMNKQSIGTPVQSSHIALKQSKN